jgi:hypothetical protein
MGEMHMTLNLILSLVFTVVAADCFARRKWRIGSIASYSAVFFLLDATLRVAGVL